MGRVKHKTFLVYISLGTLGSITPSDFTYVEENTYRFGSLVLVEYHNTLLGHDWSNANLDSLVGQDSILACRDGYEYRCRGSVGGPDVVGGTYLLFCHLSVGRLPRCLGAHR